MYKKHCKRVGTAWIPAIGLIILASSVTAVMDSGGAESESGFVADRSGEPTDTAGFAPSKEIVGGVLEHLRPKGGKAFVPSFTEADIEALPDSFSYRDMPPVIPVRNQGACGACWAFCLASVAEKQIALLDNQVLDIAEQWILDCNTNDFDCSAGWFPYQMLMEPDACGKTGLVFESDAPYMEVKQECDCDLPRTSVYAFAYIGKLTGEPASEEHINAIKEALWKYGPIWSSVYAHSPSFMAYKSGVYNSQAPADAHTDKSIVIEGWDDTQGNKGVWVIRNTWGPKWGEEGYMRIEYGASLVGTHIEVIQYKGETSMHDEGTEIEQEGEAPVEGEGEAVERCLLAVHPLTSFEIPYSGGEAVFEVETTATWTAALSDTSWASYTVAYNTTGNDTVTILCPENGGMEPRSLTITVTGNGTNPAMTSLVLTQAGYKDTPCCGSKDFGNKSAVEILRDMLADWLLVGVSLLVVLGLAGKGGR